MTGHSEVEILWSEDQPERCGAEPCAPSKARNLANQVFVAATEPSPGILLRRPGHPLRESAVTPRVFCWT